MERDMYGRWKSSRAREPKWVGAATAVAMTVVMWGLLGWVAAVAWVASVAAVFALCVCLARKQRDNE
jgi:hypothetical protein